MFSRLFSRALAACFLCLAIFSLPMQSDAAGRLASQDLRKLFPGKFDVEVKDNRVTMIAKDDGTLIGKAWGKKDKGRWYVSGAQLCISLDNWMKGKTRCSAIVEEAGWYHGSGVRFRKL
jgi:hypothetical protein